MIYLLNFVESIVVFLIFDNKFKNLNVVNILKIMLFLKIVIFFMLFLNCIYFRILYFYNLICLCLFVKVFLRGVNDY